MTWTDPRTWVTDEVVTSSLLNTHLRDNLLSLPHPVELPTVAALDIQNTAAETTLYSVLIPGGAMGSYGSLEARIEGDVLFNNSTNDFVTIRLKFGGGTIVTCATLDDQGVSAARTSWFLDCTVRNLGATNSQHCQINGQLDDSFGNTKAFGSGAVNTASDQTLLISLQWTTASPNNIFTRRWARTTLAKN